MNHHEFPHLHIPSNHIPARSSNVNLIQEDLARAHIRARIEEAERFRIARSARAYRRMRADARNRPRFRWGRKR